ncbi:MULTISPECIES: macro domain-containing protein [Streptomyces]|uniref:Macro domain-containing protein n=1 Tax=Streptomyces flaveolus TaxID=67297 RepID=A0ABV3A2M2_9ACTN|nr:MULTISPECIES: macro domain-containing protein [Streptomyces]
MRLTGPRPSPRSAWPRLLRSWRDRRVFAGSVLAAFGGVSAVVQFTGQLFPGVVARPGLVLAGSVTLCLAWGLARARPQAAVRQEFARPGMTVVVEEGDLFEQPGQLVVGFTDTFDTVVDDGVVINDGSVQGQLLARRYAGDARRLDAELAAALEGVTPVAWESARDKPRGKRARYPVGTVAVLGTRPDLVFAVAYSRMGNDCVASSKVQDLWLGLDRLWDAVHRHGQLERLTMPLTGAGLARLHDLDEDSLLRLILLSFVVHSWERPVCRELHVVVRPGELARIDLPETGAFLAGLAAGARRHV